MQALSWITADKRTYVHWADKKYDIMVFGMPQDFHYGNGMGTNPIQMMQALSRMCIRDRVVIGIIVIAVIGALLSAVLTRVERWLCPWKEE